jgi:Beta propeller domain
MRTPSCTTGFTLAKVFSRRLLVLLAVTGALAAIPGSASARSRKAHLSEFRSCSSFVHYARRHARGELRTMGTPTVRPVFPPQRGPVFPEGVAAPPQANSPTAVGEQGQDYSTTNVQESGVDEPDLVKTDGKRIFAVENGTLYSVDARTDPPKVLDSLVIAGYGQELLLVGDKVLVFSGTNYVLPVEMVAPGAPQQARTAVAAPIYGGVGSTLTEVDVSNPSAMKVVQSMSVNGSYLSARLTGHTARVVLSAIPEAIPILQATPPVTADLVPKIRRTTTPSWRPTYKLRRGTRGRLSRHALVRCTHISRPVQFSGLNSLTVLTIDLDKGLEPVDSDAIMTDGQIVYASTKALYVATQKAIVERPDTTQPPPDQVTEIHKFDISDPDQTTYQGSGAVDGTLLNQFSMSEQDGFLRVASTSAPLWWSQGNDRPSQSYVTVLAQKDNTLQAIGRVGDLGKGQRIYAVRFLGDVGYVVTFRQIDPLYTIGLSDPEHPKVLGALDLLGYSAYLHPVGDGLLLGVGQAADEQGRTQGTQLSLFDVSDPANPARIAQHELGSGSNTSVEFDHHAFLWWSPSKLAVLPVFIYNYDPNSGNSSQFAGAIGFHVAKGDGINEAGRISHPQQSGYSPGIDRSLVIGDELYTVSMLGVKASDLGSFADRGFAEFPQPPQAQPQPGTVSSPPAR